MPRYPFEEWLAEQCRLTVFPTPGAAGLLPDVWWREIVDSLPDQTVTNPRMSSTLLTGTFRAEKLILKLEPGRIDWLLVPADLEPGAQSGDFPTIGPITDALNLFSDVVERWLPRSDVPDIGRIAFGVVLKHVEADRRAGYIRLPEYVPIRVDPESTDFVYQINIPMDSRTGIEGLRINQLSKWSISRYTQMAFRFTGTGVAPSPPAESVHAFRLELDINTAPEFPGPIPRGRLIDIYRELVTAGRRIATDGLVRQ